MIWLAWTAAPHTAAEPPTAAELAAEKERAAAVQAWLQERDRARQQKEELNLALCRQAAACKKYSEARLECATAGNFKTCLRIKMGEDAAYIGMCSGYED